MATNVERRSLSPDVERAAQAFETVVAHLEGRNPALAERIKQEPHAVLPQVSDWLQVVLIGYSGVAIEDKYHDPYSLTTTITFSTPEDE